MLAIHGTPVTWRHLILSALLLLLCMGSLSAAAAWWAWHNLAARVVLKEQMADVVLPRELAVRARVEQKVQVKVDENVSVRVPIQQDLTIPLDGDIPIQVSIDTAVPIAIDVPIKHVLKVDQTIDLDTKVRTRVLGFEMNLPVQARIPVKTDVPIDLTIPVRKTLPVALVTQAKVRLHEPLRTHVDTVIDTQVPIKAALTLPVTAPVAARLTFPDQHVQAGLNLMDITVPFDAVTLGLRERGRPLPPAVPASR